MGLERPLSSKVFYQTKTLVDQVPPGLLWWTPCLLQFPFPFWILFVIALPRLPTNNGLLSIPFLTNRVPSFALGFPLNWGRAFLVGHGFSSRLFIREGFLLRHPSDRVFHRVFPSDRVSSVARSIRQEFLPSLSFTGFSTVLFWQTRLPPLSYPFSKPGFS